MMMMMMIIIIIIIHCNNNNNNNIIIIIDNKYTKTVIPNYIHGNYFIYKIQLYTALTQTFIHNTLKFYTSMPIPL